MIPHIKGRDYCQLTGLKLCACPLLSYISAIMQLLESIDDMLKIKPECLIPIVRLFTHSTCALKEMVTANQYKVLLIDHFYPIWEC